MVERVFALRAASARGRRKAVPCLASPLGSVVRCRPEYVWLSAVLVGCRLKQRDELCRAAFAVRARLQLLVQGNQQLGERLLAVAAAEESEAGRLPALEVGTDLVHAGDRS